jgi:hypothetical protein
MSNVKMHYLYRDGSNYKNWAEIVFSGVDGWSVESATNGLRSAFLPDGLFIAHQVRIPEAFLAAEDNLTSDDHCFHEFDSVEATSDFPNDPCSRSIRQFMAEVAREAEHGWRAFNPQDRLTVRHGVRSATPDFPHQT